MSTDIHIKTTKFNFKMKHEQMAFELYGSWNSFLSSSFTPIIEKVMSQYDLPDHSLIIPSLQLDLGEINESDFYLEFPVRLEAKLTELMKEFTRTATGKEVQVKQEQSRQFDRLSCYLLHGYYPWNTSENQKNFKDLFISVLSGNAKQLSDFLRTYGHYSSLKKRLILLLNDPELMSLVQVLNPIESPFITNYFQLLINQRTHEQITKAPQKDYRDACWETILAFLFVNTGGNFNRLIFLRQTIKDLADHYSLEFSILVHFLTDILARIPYSVRYHSELIRLLDEIAQSIPPEEITKPNQQDYSKNLLDLNEVLRTKQQGALSPEWLMKALSSADFRAAMIQNFSAEQLVELSLLYTPKPFQLKFQNHIDLFFYQLIDQKLTNETELNIRQIEDLLKHQPDWPSEPQTLQSILRSLSHPLSRRKIIRTLKTEELHQLVRIIRPAEHKFIIAYSETLEKQNERNVFEGHTDGEFKLLKWEFIFTVLTENTDSSFNRKAFVSSVLNSLSAHYNLSYFAFLTYVYQSIINHEINTNDRQLISLLKELYLAEKSIKAPRQVDDPFNENIKNEYYCQCILDFIRHGVISPRSNPDRLLKMLEYILSYCPEQTGQLIEKLKDGFTETDFIVISNQQKFYHTLILAVIRYYQLNFPRNRELKSLLGRLSQREIARIPITNYKLLLKALIQNKQNTYEKAWNAFTQKTPSDNASVSNFNYSLNQIIYLLQYPDNEQIVALLTNNSDKLFKQLFSSTETIKRLTESSRINPFITRSVKQLLSQLATSTIIRQIQKFFPEKSFEINLIFQSINILKLSFKELSERTLTQILVVLSTNNIDDEIRTFFKLIADNIQSKTIRAQLIANIEKELNSSTSQDEIVQLKEIQRIINKNQHNTKPVGEIESPEENFIQWLDVNFGTQPRMLIDLEVIAERIDQPLAYSRFEELLTSQTELILQQLNQKILDKNKMSQWLKTAPKILQLRWMQLTGNPYHRQVVSHCFQLIQWMQDLTANRPNQQLNHSEILNHLFDFCSGKQQNLNEQELISILLQQTLKNLREKEQKEFLNKLYKKACNKGNDWKLRLKPFKQELNSEKQTLTEVEKPILLETERLTKSEQLITDEIFIDNAGLVLCNPYLPRLFSLLQLTEGKEFKDSEKIERAVLLLQYLLFEENTVREHQLILNKLLCGMNPTMPVNSRIEPTAQEKEILKQLIKGMIQNWGHLGKTSPRGLIDSFLIRPGKLEKDSEAVWHLKIESRGYDVLLDRLPWNYSPIKYTWMPHPIYVKWRK